MIDIGRLPTLEHYTHIIIRLYMVRKRIYSIKNEITQDWRACRRTGKWPENKISIKPADTDRLAQCTQSPFRPLSIILTTGHRRRTSGSPPHRQACSIYYDMEAASTTYIPCMDECVRNSPGGANTTPYWPLPLYIGTVCTQIV